MCICPETTEKLMSASSTLRIEDYYKSPRISNSLLGAVENPRLLKMRMENPELKEDTPSLRIGSALDCLLTSPSRWEEDFAVVNVNKPYGFMGKFVDELPANLTELSAWEDYQNAYWKSGYKMPVKWVINRFWTTPDAVEYYQAINTSRGKIVLSKDEYESVEKAKELILASPFAYDYFIKSKTWVELLHQVPIYFTYRGFECKALLDGIKLDHKNKIIYPFDLKTTGKSVLDFTDSFLHYGYYRQCALYTEALYSDSSPVKDLLDDGYKMEDFVFIVVETKLSSTNPALIYRTTPNTRKAGIHGGYYEGKYYKGVDQLLDELDWHMKTNNWTYPKAVFENKGVIELDIFKNN